MDKFARINRLLKVSGTLNEHIEFCLDLAHDIMKEIEELQIQIEKEQIITNAERSKQEFDMLIKGLNL